MTGLNKPYSESCEQNRGPIFTVIQPLLEQVCSVLEIGSGTGQHAVYFAKELTHLSWQPSDQSDYHAGIQMWLDEAALSNIKAPLALDVRQRPWPEVHVDAVFSANTLHIMSWPAVEDFFHNIAGVLNKDGLLLIYGPFNYNRTFTSESNARFDAWLKARDAQSGIRDFEAINALAAGAGLQLQKDYEMPSNNRLLFWIMTSQEDSDGNSD